MSYVRVRTLMGVLVLAGLVGIPMGTSARAEEAVPLEVIEVLEKPETPSDSGPAVVRFRILDGSRAGDTVTYRVAGPDAYAQVVPLALTAVRGFADPFVEVTLDRETGRLRRVVDHRDVLVDGRAAGGGSDGAAPDADGEAGGDAQRDGGGPSRRLTYRIETAFDGYGTARAPRPSGDVGADVETRVKGFLMDLFTY